IGCGSRELRSRSRGGPMAPLRRSEEGGRNDGDDSAGEKAVKGPRRRPVSRRTVDGMRRAGTAGEAAGRGRRVRWRRTGSGERTWKAWALGRPAEGNVRRSEVVSAGMEGRQ